MKHLILNKWGKNHKMTFEIGQYANNGNLYVGLISHDDGYPEPWQNLTVNLGVKCKECYAFIDTNHNGNEIVDWLVNNGIGQPTGYMIPSGFCVYPEFKFDMDALMQYVEGK